MASGVKMHGTIETNRAYKYPIYKVGVPGSDKVFAIQFSPRKHYQDGEYSPSVWVVEEFVEGIEPFTTFKTRKIFKHSTHKDVPQKMIGWIKRNS